MNLYCTYFLKLFKKLYKNREDRYSLNLNQSKSTDYQWKLTDLTVKNIFFTDESVKRQITDSISENLTDSDLDCRQYENLLQR